MLCHSGQREGEAVSLLSAAHNTTPANTNCFFFLLLFGILTVSLTKIVSIAGIITRLQLHVCWLPFPARQTVWHHIRHRWQGYSVWTSCRYLQVLAYVEGKGVYFISCFLTKPLSSVLLYLECNGNNFSLFQSAAKGTVGFEQHIDKCLDLSAYLYNKIKNREGFEMVFSGEVRSNECTNIHYT